MTVNFFTCSKLARSHLCIVKTGNKEIASYNCSESDFDFDFDSNLVTLTLALTLTLIQCL